MKIDEVKILDYTELKVGELYLMTNGEVHHLIGDKIIGDCIFLFSDNKGGIHLTYPGLPGYLIHPIYEMSKVFKSVDEELKEIRKEKVEEAKQLLMEKMVLPDMIAKEVKGIKQHLS